VKARWEGEKRKGVAAHLKFGRLELRRVFLREREEEQGEAG